MSKNGAGYDPDIEDVPNDFFYEDRRVGHNHHWATSDTDPETGMQVRMCTYPGCEVREVTTTDGIIIDVYDRRINI